MKPLLLIFLLHLCLAAHALPTPAEVTDDPAKRREAVDYWLARLAQAHTPADSIHPLYNLFDITLGEKDSPWGMTLVHTATRAGNADAALDALRNVANLNGRNDSILELTRSLAESWPDSDDRTQTITFIRMLRNSYAAQYATPDERERMLQELLRKTSVTPPKGRHDRIVLLHAICIYLAEVSEGELLVDYLQRMGKLIEEIPGTEHALRNAYYVYASLIYSRAGESQLAVDASKALLKEIDLLDQRNRELGRLYRSYDANRYLAYSRILENYNVLTPTEIERFYQAALAMAQSDRRAAKNQRDYALPSIYYFFSKKDYGQAYPLLEKALANPKLQHRRLQLTQMYLTAAEATGNRDALLATYPEYVKLLEDELQSRQQARYRELQVLYDVNEMRADNLRLLEEQQFSRKSTWRRITIASFVAIALLIVFLIFLTRLNGRRRILMADLKSANERLRQESESLLATQTQLQEAHDRARHADALKTDFISNMSHEVTVPLQAVREYTHMIVENIDDSKRKYVSSFADRLGTNVDLVTTIINDVLQLAELSNSTIKIKEQPYDVANICETAADAIRLKLKPGVELQVNSIGGNFTLVTDRHRLIQILVNLLSNAAKFTSEGEITLTYKKSADSRQAIFTVTDSGIGIDPKHREVIFDRFTKLDRNIPGAGIGLTISRMLARLMGGDIRLDTTNLHGARFILTLPIK